jgi:hypothetical protein
LGQNGNQRQADAPATALAKISTKTAEASVLADLDSVFLAMASVAGALIAVIVRAGLLLVASYSDSPPWRKTSYRFNARRIAHDSLFFAIIACLLPPLLVASANLTQKLEVGLSIRVIDFFGAALVGFGVHWLVMKTGQSLLDRILSTFTRHGDRPWV